MSRVSNALKKTTLTAVQRRPCVKIVVCAPKGGVGKTTIIMGLLVCARNAGKRAIGINMDEQQTLTTWGAYREKARGRIECHDVPVLARDMDDYRRVMSEVEDYDLAIFDTPPGHSHFRSAIATLCAQADLIVIPTGASTVDLTEVIPFGEQYAGNRGVFCLNGVNRRTASFQRAQQRLLKSGRLCPVAIPRLEGIHTYFEKGLTVSDIAGAQGSEDFEAVWNFVRREVAL
jgi:chromosome partitioning protein